MHKVKVSLLFNGRLHATTGASTVIRNIADGFSERQNIDMLTYALDAPEGIDAILNNTQTDNNKSVSADYKTKVKALLHQFFHKYGKTNYIVAGLYFWLAYVRNSQSVVKNYLKNSSSSDVDILFFHELTTPYCFKKANEKLWHEKKKIVVLHSDGNIMKMLFSYFPVLGKNSKSIRYFNNQMKEVLDDVDRVVLLSNNAKKIFEEKYLIYADKVVVVPNGLAAPKVDQKVQSKGVKKIFTTVGTVCSRKGHDLLISAIEMMTERQRSSFELHIVGDGSLLPELKSRCASNNLDNVKFIGSQKNVYDYLLRSDVFILASRNEGLPMAIIEAMACRLPIIATNVGGVLDLVSAGNNGWLVKPDAKAINMAMCEALSFDNLSKYGEYSYLLFNSKFSSENMVFSYESIFKEICHDD